MIFFLKHFIYERDIFSVKYLVVYIILKEFIKLIKFINIKWNAACLPFFIK